MKLLYKSALVTLLFSVAILNTRCSRPTSTTEPSASAPSTSDLILNQTAVDNLALGIATVGPVELRQRIFLQGELTIDEHRLALIPSRIAGVVENVVADVGSEINEGQNLVSLSSQDLADRIMGYVETERRFQAAMVDLDRERKLYDKQVSTEEQFLKVEREYHSAENEHAVALQRLRLLGYQESQLHEYLDRPDLKDMTHYFVSSPIDGEVLERYFNLGEAIEPGTRLFKVANLANLWLTFQLPLRYRNAVSTDMEIRFKNESLDLEGTALVALIEDVMDPRTRTIKIRANVKNPNKKWIPGMPIQVDFEGLGNPVERAVPIGAIQQLEDDDVVFVSKNGNVFSPVPVKIGKKDYQYVELLEGPETGTQVVTTNSYLLKQAWENKE